jgi:hypothetical protein
MSRETPKDRQKRLAAAGRCRIHSDRPAAPGSTYCVECNDNRARRARERYQHSRGDREVSRTYTCSVCGEKGHSKTTCPNRVKGGTEA